MILKIQPVIESFHDISQNRAVLTPTGSNCHIVPRFEQLGLTDGVVDLGLKSKIKTFFAQRVPGFWPLQNGSFSTFCAALHWHVYISPRLGHYDLYKVWLYLKIHI